MVANFNYLQIFYYKNESGTGKVYNSAKIDSPNGRMATLQLTHNISNNTQQILSKLVSISNTSITVKWERTSNIEGNSITGNSSTNELLISKVLGYK